MRKKEKILLNFNKMAKNCEKQEIFSLDMDHF